MKELPPRVEVEKLRDENARLNEALSMALRCATDRIADCPNFPISVLEMDDTQRAIADAGCHLAGALSFIQRTLEEAQGEKPYYDSRGEYIDSLHLKIALLEGKHMNNTNNLSGLMDSVQVVVTVGLVRNVAGKIPTDQEVEQAVLDSLKSSINFHRLGDKIYQNTHGEVMLDFRRTSVELPP